MCELTWLGAQKKKKPRRQGFSATSSVVAKRFILGPVHGLTLPSYQITSHVSSASARPDARSHPVRRLRIIGLTYCLTTPKTSAESTVRNLIFPS